MRKVIALAVLATFGADAMAQSSFRHPQQPFINRPTRPNTLAFDEVEDNNLALNLNLPKDPNSYRIRFDDAADDELFTQGDMGRMGGFLGSGNSGIIGGGGSAPGGVAWGGAGQYAHQISKNTHLIGGASISHAPGSRVNIQPHVGVKFNFDDAADDEMFTQGDMGRMGGFLGSGNSGIIGGGGSAPGGVAWGGAGQYAHQIGKNTHLIGGASVSHAPGSRVNIQPHVGVKFNFDDAADDEMFSFNQPRFSTPPYNLTPRIGFDDAEDNELASLSAILKAPNAGVNFDDAADDEMFTQGDMGRMGGFLGSGNSGIIGGGGSAPGGVAWGGAGQYAHQIGKNTHLIGGATVSHAPGSKVNIQPHVGVKWSF